MCYNAIITGFSSETLSGSLKLLFLCSSKKCPVRGLWWKRKTLFEWPTWPSIHHPAIQKTPLWVNFRWTPTLIGVGSTLVPSYMPHIPTRPTYLPYAVSYLPTPSTSYLPTPQPPTYPPCSLPTPIHCLHHQAFQVHSTPLGWSSHGGLCSKPKLSLMPWSSCMQLGGCGAWRSSLTPWTKSWRSKISLPSLSFPGLVSLKFL